MVYFVSKHIYTIIMKAIENVRTLRGNIELPPLSSASQPTWKAPGHLPSSGPHIHNQVSESEAWLTYTILPSSQFLVSYVPFPKQNLEWTLYVKNKFFIWNVAYLASVQSCLTLNCPSHSHSPMGHSSSVPVQAHSGTIIEV